MTKYLDNNISPQSQPKKGKRFFHSEFNEN